MAAELGSGMVLAVLCREAIAMLGGIWGTVASAKLDTQLKLVAEGSADLMH